MTFVLLSELLLNDGYIYSSSPCSNLERLLPLSPAAEEPRSRFLMLHPLLDSLGFARPRPCVLAIESSTISMRKVPVVRPQKKKPKRPAFDNIYTCKYSPMTYSPNPSYGLHLDRVSAFALCHTPMHCGDQDDYIFGWLAGLSFLTRSAKGLHADPDDQLPVDMRTVIIHHCWQKPSMSLIHDDEVQHAWLRKAVKPSRLVESSSIFVYRVRE